MIAAANLIREIKAEIAPELSDVEFVDRLSRNELSELGMTPAMLHEKLGLASAPTAQAPDRSVVRPEMRPGGLSAAIRVVQGQSAGTVNGGNRPAPIGGPNDPTAAMRQAAEQLPYQPFTKDAELDERQRAEAFKSAVMPAPEANPLVQQVDAFSAPVKVGQPVPPGYQPSAAIMAAMEPNENFPELNPSLVNPEGTALGRALRRGILNTRVAGPTAMADLNARQLQDARMGDQMIAETFKQFSGLPEIPEGLNVTTPEAAAKALSDLGYPASMVSTFSDAIQVKQRNQQIGTPKLESALLNNLQAAGELTAQAQELPMSAYSENLKRDLAESDGGFRDTASTLVQNFPVLPIYAAESAVEAAPSVLAAFGTAAATRSPALTSLALGATGLAPTYASTTDQLLREKGIRLESPSDARRVLTDLNLLREASQRGAARGLVVAAFEMLGQGAVARNLAGHPVADMLIDQFTQRLTATAGEVGGASHLGKRLTLLPSGWLLRRAAC